MSSAGAGEAPQAISPDESLPALEANPQHLGYAFDQPEILVRQRLFGLAHGLSLLAAACLDLPEHSSRIQEAYAAWHRGQGKSIETLVHDLARYYFGPRAPEARWPDLVRALNLGDSIRPSLGAISLQDACTSLPEAIFQPRYQFDTLLVEASAPSNHSTAATGVPPAPTIVQPAQ